jgi:hypothetical protein
MSLDSFLDRLAGQPVIRRRKKRLRPTRFIVEALERRVLLTTYTVTSNDPFAEPTPSNPQNVGLEYAMTRVNFTPMSDGTPDVINFQIPGGGVQTITLVSKVPGLAPPALIFNHSVTIDGTSQPGYTPGHPMVDIDGSKAGDEDGLTFTVGDNTVKGLIINNFQETGIVLDGTNDNTHGKLFPNNVLQDNFIGTDATGKNAAANATGGIQILNSSFNLIGGLNFGGQLTQGNLISGNGQNGIFLASATDTNNYIEGNFIGTDITGLKPIAGAQSASYGVALVPPLDNLSFGDASNNFIGDFDPVENQIDHNGLNVISGNTADGVLVVGGTLNQILGNYIGVGVDGKTPVANGQDGIRLEDASSNTVGGTTSGSGNVISGNSEDGLEIVADAATDYGLAIPVSRQGASFNTVEGNLIGTEATGKVAVPNGNSSATGTDVYGEGIALENLATDASVVVTLNVIGGLNTNPGGTLAGGGNLISGNWDDGILMLGPNVSINTVEGNYIGSDVTGKNALDNRNCGVKLDWSVAGETKSSPTGNIIGSTEIGGGNLISGNGTPGQGSTAGTDGGISIDGGASANVIQNNLIGTDATGLKSLPNADDGITIIDGNGNTIGGTAADAGNVISGNIAGLYIDATGNRVEKNLIGVGVDDATPLPNLVGVGVFGSDSIGNVIGGVQTVGNQQNSLGNVISANTLDGIDLQDANSNQVLGNMIGTDLAGKANLGNGQGGIVIEGSSSNTIGGTTTAARNLIVFNRTDGIDFNGETPFGQSSGNVIEGDFIGVGPDGITPEANLFNGILINNNSLSNIIGGHTDVPGQAPGNLIDCNLTGIYITNGQNTVIQGDQIASNTNDGIDIDGSASQQNYVDNNVVKNNANTGIDLENGATNNFIGEIGAGNTIILNHLSGVTIVDAGTSENHVQSNHIGIDDAGFAQGNLQSGVLINSGAHDNIIGGTFASEGNVISANAVGVQLQDGTAGNSILGNLIGTGLDGTFHEGLGNTTAGVVSLVAGPDTIGGPAIIPGSSPGNKILGNAIGVVVQGGTETDSTGKTVTAQGNTIEGNEIANSDQYGIKLYRGTSINDIGGSDNDEANSIHDNGSDGVYVDDGTGNSIQHDLIFNNTGLGIHLDQNHGGNNRQASPVLNLATTGGSHRLAGSMTGKPNTTYTLDFYYGNQNHQNSDGSENDDAEHFFVPLPPTLPETGVAVGTGVRVTTNIGGVCLFDLNLPNDIPDATTIRATATDPNGNTSQFSNAVIVSTDTAGTGVPDNQQNGNRPSPSNVTFPDALNNNQFINIQTDPVAFHNVWSVPDPDPNVPPPNGPPSNTQFGLGFISFSLVGAPTAPTPVLVTMTLPDTGTTPTSYWRYGPTPDNQTDHWYNWIWDGNPADTGAQIMGNTIVLHLIDGALGDDDLTANGTIVDAGGPGFPGGPYTVTTTADSGPGSLRQAILNANANPENTITFNLPGSGPQTIEPLSPLPAITADVTIDGSTQPGFAGTPLVVIDGSQAGAGADGLDVDSGDVTIQDLVVDHFSGDGILVSSIAVATIAGNYIGTDPTGKIAAGNGLYGVQIEDTSNDPDNDGDNDELGAGDNDDDAGNVGQQSTVDGGNVISANLAGGISILGYNAYAWIVNNFVGTGADGTSPLGNGGPGVVLDGGSQFNTIGDDTPGDANTIAYNAGPGIDILNGMFNDVQSNSIFANQGLGIDLNSADNANELQPAPVLASAASEGSETFISGTLTAAPNSSFTIDFYANDQADPSGFGQGQTWLGSTLINTDGSGQASFDATLPASAATGSFITATSSYRFETSEFSNDLALTPTSPLVLIVNTTEDSSDAIPGCMDFSLRDAFQAANAHPGLNTIDFDLPNSNRVISIQSPLPAFTNPVIIDGTTQPGYEGLPLVELDGSLAGAGANGLDITGGGSVVRGLDIHSFSGYGIELNGAGGNVIQGDFLGTDVTGAKTMPNQGGDLFINGSRKNTIGGTTAADRNVILAMQVVSTGAIGNLVEGNFIGSDLTGTAVLDYDSGFHAGIELGAGGNGNTIGGLQPGAGNLIEHGLVIDAASNNNVVQGNLIGTDVTGTVFLSSGTFANAIVHGVAINGGANQLGGTTAAARNIITGDVGVGGELNTVQGNYIGTDISGTVALGAFPDGIDVAGTNNTIGGAQPGAGNLISGAPYDGMSLGGGYNTVQGNRIGTDVTGTKALGNARFGINAGGYFNTIGGNLRGEGNLISASGASGIFLTSGSDTVQGNLIGTDSTGTRAIGNGLMFRTNSFELLENGWAAGIDAGVSGATIGGSQPGDGNVISGSVGDGIAAGGGVTGLVIQGNEIGTDSTGTMPLGNGGDGIYLATITNAIIGGASPWAGNVISANAGDGIDINDSDDPGAYVGDYLSSGTVIQGNKIGTDVTGTHNLGNAGDGVSLITSNLFPSDETIGGTDPGEGNTVAFNGGWGVDIPFGQGNAVRGNDIFSNVGLGLVTDINGTASTYAENRGIQLPQAAPVLTSAVFDPQGTVVTGSLTGTPFTQYEIDFFANDAVNPTGFGDGQTYLQSISVLVDDTGSAQFQVPLDVAVPIGQWITATATPDTTDGNTSMFSQPVPVVAAAGNTVQFSSPNYLVTDTGGVAVITVTRSGDTSGTATVDYTTSGGSATAGVNYMAESGTLTFAAGVTTQTITVPVEDDGLADGNKDFQILLSNPSGASLGGATAADVTIADSDTAGVIQFSSPTYDVDRADGYAVFTLTRTGGSQAAVSLEYLTGGTASNAIYQTYNLGDNFGTITFAPGQTTAQIQYFIGDSPSGPQTLQVTIGNPTGGAVLGATTTSVMTIDDPEDQSGAFAIQIVAQPFDESGFLTATSAPQAYQLSQDALLKVSVGRISTTVDLTAAATASNASAGDLVNELNALLARGGFGGSPTAFSIFGFTLFAQVNTAGALQLVLGGTGNYGLFSVSDAGPGTPNDGYAQLGFTNPQSDLVPAVIEVERLGPSGTTQEVSYTTEDGTATAGTNYVATSGTLTFQPGQTQAQIDVPLIGDDVTGTFQVVLSGPTGGAFILNGLGQCTVTIPSAAPPPPDTLVVETANDDGNIVLDRFPENSGTQTITVIRVNPVTGFADGGGTGGTVSVDYRTSDGTAQAGSDYTAESGTLTFGPGQEFASFVVPILPGHDFPGTRTFFVTLSNVVGDAVISSDNPVAENIVGTPGQIEISSSSYSVAQNKADLTVTVTNLPGSNLAGSNVTIDYATHDGTATAGTDYTPVSGTLTFTAYTAGATSQTITIPILNDLQIQNDKTFYLTLSNPLGGPGIGTNGTAEITILPSVVPDQTCTMLTSDHPAGSTYGQTVTLTATVVAPDGTPTGTVDFFDSTTRQDLGTAPLSVVNGVDEASLPVTSLAAGSHSIIATYTPDNGAFLTSQGWFTQTVAPATLTVAADNKTIVFGATLPALTDTITGFVNGDTASVVSGAPTLSTTATSTSGVGSYSITVSSGTLSASNYNFTFVGGTLLVVPAQLTLTVAADDKTMVYGSTVPALTDTISGFVNGDTSSVVSGAPSLSTTATSASGVGSYPIDVSLGTLSAANYTFAFIDGTLTVTPAILFVTADNKTMVYGATVPTLTDTITGFVNGDTASVVSGAASLSTTATSASDVGNYAITVGLGTLTAANYHFAFANASPFVNASLSVTPATLKVSAVSTSMVYGSKVPTLTDTITGFVNGDASSVVSGTALLSTTATSASGVGNYPITAAVGSLRAANYSFTFANATLSIIPATLTVAADNKTMVFGSTVPALTYTITGFVNGDTASVVSGTASIGTTATSTSAVGSYGIGVGRGTLHAANYTFPNSNIYFIFGTLFVVPANLTLTVSADDKTMVYGSTVPALTDTITGFVADDTASVVSGAASLSTTATSASPVGSYPIDVSLGTLSAANYTFTLVDGTLTVVPATLTVTADDQTMVYGATVPALTDTITGFVNGDTASVVSGFASLSTNATSASAVGNHSITVTPGTLSAENYTFAVVRGTMAVTPATLTVTADDKTMVYGATVPTLTDTITGFVNGDTSGVVSGAPDLSTAATSASGVGNYAIAVTQNTLSAENYTFDFVNGTLSVTPAPLTVTADFQTMVYGATVPSLTDTISGFVNGDTSSVVSGAASLSTAANSTSGVGNYNITPAQGTLSAANYSFAFVNGALVVTPATLTVTADDKTMVFGATVPALTDTFTGFVNGDTASVVSGAASLSTAATSASAVGDYPIDVAYGTLNAANYIFAFVDGTLSVLPATLTLTVTADDKTMVYGATVPTLTDTITGFVNGDTASVVSGAADLSTTATSASGVGSYPIDVSLGTLSAANYTFVFVDGTLTVTPAPLTITANDQTMTYGGALPTLTASYSGFVNGDTSASLTTAPTVTAPATNHVGTYTGAIVASGAADPNYTISYVAGTLTVTPAPLTITANNQTMTYGGTLPTLTASYSGFVNGDTSATFSTSPNVAPAVTAPATDHVGTYPGVIVASGASDPDYTISYMAGTLTVTPAPLTITANDQTMTYGGTLPALTLTYTGLVNGDTPATFSTSPNVAPMVTAPATNHVGTYTGVIVASGASDPDYTISYVPGTLTVTPAPLTITANNQTMTYGGTLPTLTVSYAGLVNGDSPATLSTSANVAPTVTAPATNHVGTYTGVIVASGASDPDYTISYAAGTLTVTPATLTVTADNKTKVYGAANPSLTDTTTGFVNGDTASVVSGAATLTTTATSTSPVGTYPIVVGIGTLNAANYTFTVVNGTLTVISPAALVVLDPTSKGSVTVTGNGNVQVTGNAEVLSNSQQAIVASGNASVSATKIDIEGSPGTSLSGNAKIAGTVIAGLTPAQDPSLSDPFAALPTPAQPTATFAAASYSGKATATLNPGTYTGGISVSGKAVVTLLPGLYYLKGGGLSVSGNGSVTGNGLVIYNAPQSAKDAISVTGQGTITLTAPTSGAYQGVGIFQDRSSSVPITVSGNGSLGVTGSIYAAAATLNISGNAQAQVYGNGSLVVYDLVDSGNSLTVDVSQGPRASAAGDPPSIMAIAGTISGDESSTLTGVTVATFTDSDATLAAGDFTAVIDWGDGTTSAGSVALVGATFAVTGTHAYQDEGHYTVGVTVCQTNDSSVAATVATPATIHEELLADGTVGTPDENYIQEIYRDLFGRQAEMQGLDYWVAELSQGISRQQVAYQMVQIASFEEFQHDTVAALYQQYLGRAPDAAGLAYWSAYLYNGGTIEGLSQALVTSPEYWEARAGGTAEGFVSALFQDALGRAVEPAALTYFTGMMATGASAADLAASVFNSDEYHRLRVNSLFEQFMHRPGDQGALAYFAGELDNGGTDELVISQLLASDEYYALAQV